MRRHRFAPLLFLAVLASQITPAAFANHPPEGEINVVQPDAIAINRTTNRMYSVTGYDDSLRVVDLTSGSLIATVTVGDSPIAVAVNETTNRVYVANYNSGNLSVVDGSTNAVLTTVAVGTQVRALAINEATNRVYVGDYYGVTSIDGDTNSITKVYSVPYYVHDLAVDPAANKVYGVHSPCYYCTPAPIFVIDETSQTLNSLAWVYGVGSIAINPARNEVYLSYYSEIYVLDATNGSTVGYVGSDDYYSTIYDLLFDSSKGRLYAARYYGYVEAIDLTYRDDIHRWTLATTAITSLALGQGNKIYASEPAGSRVVSFVDDVPDPTVPGAPQSLQATVSDRAGNIKLNWSPPTDDGGLDVTSYRVYRGTEAGGFKVQVFQGNAFAFSDDGLPNETTFYYEVSAVNPVGEGAHSAEVAATTLGLSSDDCAGGTTVLDGWYGTVFARLAFIEPTPGTTWVCMKSNASPTVGGKSTDGKLVIGNVSGPSAPTVDEDSSACSGPGALPVGPFGAEVGDPSNPPYIQVSTFSGVKTSDLNEVSVCADLTAGGDEIKKRVLIPVGVGGVSFESDPIGAQPGSESPSSGDQSSLCQDDPQYWPIARVRVLNGNLGGNHVSLYGLTEWDGTTHLCVRTEGDDTQAGGRLTLSLSGFPGLYPQIETSFYDTNYCTVQVLKLTNPSIEVTRSPTSDGTSASICIRQGGTIVRLTARVDGALAPPDVNWNPDS